MNAKITPLMLAALFALCACGSSRPRNSGSPRFQGAAKADAQAASEEAALASALRQLNSKKADYRISAADLLGITIYQQLDLDRMIRVGQNGMISMPLIGVVKVGGLTVNEAESMLAEKYREYLVNPQVTVFIKEYANKRVFVLGQVHKPGSFELPTESKLTVLEAVSMAGGFTPIAAADRTKVIRTVNGQSANFTITVSDITRNGEKEKDLSLEPGDVVFVPQSFF